MLPETVDHEPKRVLLSLLEIPIALGVAFATFVAFSAAGCKWAHCVDISGLPWYLGGALLGIAAGVVYWVKSMRLRNRFRTRLIVDAIAILIGISGYVLPQIGGWRAQAEAEAKRAATRNTARAPGVEPAPPTPQQPRIAR